MSSDFETGERTPLLTQRRVSLEDVDASLLKDDQRFDSGERLPYNDYTTIDWLHDLIKDSRRSRHINALPGVRYRLLDMFDQASGWIAVVVIGALTAVVAFLVDVAVATVADWKEGYCSASPWKSRDNCCRDASSAEPVCEAWHAWSDSYGKSFAVYVALALVFGVISSSATMLTKCRLPSVEEPEQTPVVRTNASHPSSGVRIPTRTPTGGGKVMYMAAGSGIPEIKTILSGFSIPSFLSFKVLVVKAFGAVFAVSTGMCLGKEGPFVHISTCVGYLVGCLIPKYNSNGRKMRELLSAACSSGLSVAFGAPIGGVLFSYEEISTYFPRLVLWRSFLCSLTAAMVLKSLNPTGTGKLVLFETNYGTAYEPAHYLVFALLGIAGGLFGGVFCKLNLLWSTSFRALPVIKRNPVLEVALVVLLTAGLQYPNPLTRDTGDVLLKSVLVDCTNPSSSQTFICMHESTQGVDWPYTLLLTAGTLSKLLLTIITFGTKVPSGVIIPSLDAGALFGRLIATLVPSTPSVSPGLFALVGSAAFLAGVSRMTISLAVIMLELTGELEYAVPNMVAILIAKWVADAISQHSVYDVAQSVLGHPFLDADVALHKVRKAGLSVQALIPPQKTMRDITVEVPGCGTVPASLLREKLARLEERGLMDAGLVLVRPSHGVRVLRGYVAQGDVERGLARMGEGEVRVLGGEDEVRRWGGEGEVRFLGGEGEAGRLGGEDESDAQVAGRVGDLTGVVDTAPLVLSETAPLEYAVEVFGRLGVRCVCVVDCAGGVVGVVIKKRLVGFVERLE